MDDKTKDQGPQRSAEEQADREEASALKQAYDDERKGITASQDDQDPKYREPEKQYEPQEEQERPSLTEEANESVEKLVGELKASEPAEGEERTRGGTGTAQVNPTKVDTAQETGLFGSVKKGDTPEEDDASKE